MQWAAVSTAVRLTATPPQNCPARVPPNRSRLDSATVHGLSETSTGNPPTTMLSATTGDAETSGMADAAAARTSGRVNARARGRRMHVPHSEMVIRDPE
jgi:hypothetical protein